MEKKLSKKISVRKQKILAGICLAAVCVIASIGAGLTDSRLAVTVSAPLDNVPSRPVVVIDAGHGGMDGGCVSVNGVAEKGINLNIALTLRDILAVMGWQPICTRESDVSIHDDGTEGLANQKKSDMENRLAIINKYSDAVAVSIHQNQFTDSAYSGAQMFYPADSSESMELAETLKSQFVSLLQPENTRETKPVGDELYLLNNASCPMVMAECGFLSNPDEAALLESEDYQGKVAFTIFTALSEEKIKA